MADDVSRVAEEFGISSLKVEQIEILNCLIDRKDCMAVLPTGYGKSLPFQMFCKVVKAKDKQASPRVIVCCPLVSLMKDQVSRLEKIPGITAAYRGESAEKDEAIRKGEIDVIFASPETLVGDAEWRSALQSLSVDVIVVDEFHVIASWGEDFDGSKKVAFRKWFSHIGDLRSLFPTACMLALSATCTIKVRKRVEKVLGLDEGFTFISASPNKPNIKLTTAKIPRNIEISMAWLVEALQDKFDEFPLTVIYATSISDVSKLYVYITEEFPESKAFVEMYHSETLQEKKDYIFDELKNPHTAIKVVVATNALGMGVDIPKLHSVVLYGVPETFLDLLQQIGRAGRDGEPSVALILKAPHHGRKAEKEVKELFSSQTCRRIHVMKSFLTAVELENLKEESNKHSCCDLCELKCTCGNCSLLPLEQLFQAEESTSCDSDNMEDSSSSSDAAAEYVSDIEDLFEEDFLDD